MNKHIHLSRRRHTAFHNGHDSEIQFHAISKMGVGLARRGECMTNQCKFGMGNYLFIPSAGDTCFSVMRGMKLSYLQNHRLQRERTKHNTVSFEREGRIRVVWMKANTEAINNGLDASASPVSCRQHVRKVMYCKSGDLVVSINKPRKVVE
ncbi:MAG: hypothetical protein AMDU2_EPLC00011G0017 [Thermoplasmatales archaeon E-plasma]|nr:MAG: hypothetical protein AMDU2_EPLC00011G0017 [Thermoplasmatales archaeon E-plasma]